MREGAKGVTGKMATNSNHPSSSAAILADEVKSEMAILGPAEVKKNAGNEGVYFTEVAGSGNRERGVMKSIQTRLGLTKSWMSSSVSM